MIVFYSNNIEEDNIIIEGQEWNHCYKVLRKGINDLINVIDGNGKLYLCRIKEVSKKIGVVKVLEIIINQERDQVRCIGIAPTKNNSRIEWMIEKSVELGVSEIKLFISANSERRKINLDRLNKIALSACKQSLQLSLPKILFFNSLNKLLKSSSSYANRYIAHCKGDRPRLLNQSFESDDTIVIIGPEGDFTNEEIILAEKAGFTSVSLGDNRLRTETAGIITAHILSLK